MRIKQRQTKNINESFVKNNKKRRSAKRVFRNE
jgi:hypothetical protein